MHTHKILYATHDAANADELRGLLKSGGVAAAVEHAANLNEVRERLANHAFDLIVTDYCMEDGTGVTLCRHIRSFDKAIPVIFYSALSREIDIRQARDAGCSEYLVQPDDSSEIVAVIGIYLSASPIREQRRATEPLGGGSISPMHSARDAADNITSKISQALAPVATFTAAAIFLSFAAGMIARAARDKKAAVGEPSWAATLTLDGAFADAAVNAEVKAERSFV